MTFLSSLNLQHWWMPYAVLLGAILTRPTNGAVSDTTCLFTVHGTSYRGSLSTTTSGKTCQSWSSQSPHTHSYTSADVYPDATLEEAGNACRNPGGSRDRPWCFTTDVNTEWEYCNIPACECLVGADGRRYRGRESTTVSGKTCQRWDQQTPHQHVRVDARAFPDDSITEASNYCRNPDSSWRGSAWCFTTDSNTRWEKCDIPQCECKETMRGGTYQGQVSVTRSGKTCQSWTQQQPHPHNYRDGSLYSDGDIQKSKNYCRNPDSSASGGPWCLTTDPQTRWEYCDIPMCEFSPVDKGTVPSVFTTPYPGRTPPVRTVRQEKTASVQECKFDQAGTAYMGLVSNTVSGGICQRWDSQSPRNHGYTNPAWYPDETLSNVGNHCRNPGNHALGPWCYSTTGYVEWEYCDIPLCHCKTSRKGEGYLGDVHVTVSGKACQSWLDQTPHAHSYNALMLPDVTLSDARNFCRNPDGEHPDGPWCLTLEPNTRWEYCEVPVCECSPDTAGLQYAGTLTKTRSGFTCQRWDDTSVHNHNYANDDSAFIDGSVRSAENYCRNPDLSETNGPWCYTTDPDTRWEYCTVPLCSIKVEPKVNEKESRNTEESEDCHTGDGSSYVGKTSLTVSGHQCQAWSSQSPNPHDYNRAEQFPDLTLNEAKNYCRNPLEGIDSNGPWCFTTTENVRWESCGIPTCSKVEPEKPTSKPMLEVIPYECLRSEKGSEYQGTVSITESGRTCQSWLSQTPHPHSFSPSSGSSLEGAGNACRNPGGGRERPWCYTTDVNKEWEYCDIPACGCKTEIHGRNFTGPITRTASGKPCQAWSEQSPHPHSYTEDFYFKDGSVTAAGSFCRNPDENEPWGPWCFTSDPDTRWEYCDVPACECRTTVMALDYHGTISTTSGGISCQSWSKQSPHSHTLLESDSFPDRTVTEAENYCRNPRGFEAERPWCYTTDADTRWGFCDIPFCEGSTLKDLTPLPEAKSCMESLSGREYRGTVSISRQGKTCQPWRVQDPQPHRYTSRDFFPDRSLEEASNFCRNPDDSGETSGVWCYTTDPDVRWDYCDVPYCEGVGPSTTTTVSTSTTSTPKETSSKVPTLAVSTSTVSSSMVSSSKVTENVSDGQKGCKQEKTGWSFTGDLSITVSGRVCQRWDAQSPHISTHLDEASFPDASLDAAGNFCRNPGEWRPGGPWCYTTDPAVEWEYCLVKFCECRTSVKGTEYGGHRSITRSGLTCQQWSSQSPHNHRHYDDNSFPDGSIVAAENYCRNPDPDSASRPWCYTTDLNKRWEYCDIPICDDAQLPMITPTSSNNEPILGKFQGDSAGLGTGGIAAIILGLLFVMLITAIVFFILKHKKIIAKTLKAEKYQQKHDPSRDVGLTFYNNRQTTAERSLSSVTVEWPKQEVSKEAILKMRPNETLEHPTDAASIEDLPPVTVL